MHPADAPSPCPTPFSLTAHVLAAGRARPEKSALQILSPTGAERWSYARLIAAVEGLTAALIALGLRDGGRVLLRLGNSADFPVAFLACIAAGLLPVAAPAGLTAPEVTALAADLDPSLILAAPGASLPDPCPAPVLTRDQMRATYDGPGRAPLTGAPDRPAYLVYTSGTSGRPRAVLHAHRAIWARAMMHRGWYGLTEGDRLLHAGAFNWSFTLGTGLLDPWTLGATALVPAEGVTPAQMPLLLRRHDATLFAAAPGIYRQILKSYDKIDLPHLRHGLTAGESLSPHLRAAWEAATGRPLHEAYGLSECSTFISGSPDRPAPDGAIGFPQPGRRVAILDDEGALLPADAEGTIAVHRSDPGLFLGYWGAEAETMARFRGDWFLTGDRAARTDGGAIRFAGRTDDMMNAGGFRVSPAEVEAALAPCPGAGEVAAFETRVGPATTIIALAYTGTATAEALAALANARLAPYKRPRRYDHHASLPHTPNGKINRRALRDGALQEKDAMP